MLLSGQHFVWFNTRNAARFLEIWPAMTSSVEWMDIRNDHNRDCKPNIVYVGTVTADGLAPLGSPSTYAVKKKVGFGIYTGPTPETPFTNMN